MEDIDSDEEGNIPFSRRKVPTSQEKRKDGA